VPPAETGLAGLATALRREAEADPERERCGLVIREPSGSLRLVPVANVAPWPAAAFELDPAALLRALRAQDATGERLVAVYHAHPSGGATLSPRDLQALVVEGQPLLPGVEQLVIALQDGRAVAIRAHAWDGAAFVGRELWRAAPSAGAGST